GAAVHAPACVADRLSQLTVELGAIQHPRQCIEARGAPQSGLLAMPFDREQQHLMNALHRSRALLQEVLDADADELERDRVEVLARERDERKVRRDASERNGSVATVGIRQRQIDQRDLEVLPLDDVLGFAELGNAADLVFAIQKSERFGKRSCRVYVVLE